MILVFHHIVGFQPRIEPTEKTPLEKIDSRTLLLKNCVMSFQTVVSPLTYTLHASNSLFQHFQENPVSLSAIDLDWI